MISPLIKFSAKLLLLMTGLYWFHIFAINLIGLSVQDGLLKACYLFNTLIGVIFYYLLLFVSKHNPTILGWFFLLTSGIKFLLFFELIFPSFQLMDLSPHQEFLTFFVPYTTAFSLEIYQLINNLNQKK